MLLFCSWFEYLIIYCVHEGKIYSRWKRTIAFWREKSSPLLGTPLVLCFNRRRKVPTSIKLQRLCDLHYSKLPACFHITLRAVWCCFSVFAVYKRISQGWTHATKFWCDFVSVSCSHGASHGHSWVPSDIISKSKFLLVGGQDYCNLRWLKQKGIVSKRGREKKSNTVSLSKKKYRLKALLQKSSKRKKKLWDETVPAEVDTLRIILSEMRHTTMHGGRNPNESHGRCTAIMKI